jgi:hypothetical protein
MSEKKYDHNKLPGTQTKNKALCVLRGLITTITSPDKTEGKKKMVGPVVIEGYLRKKDDPAVLMNFHFKKIYNSLIPNPISLIQSDRRAFWPGKNHEHFNTSYLTNSCIGFTLKMESLTKNTIFGLKMMVKSGLEKFILKSLHAGR